MMPDVDIEERVRLTLDGETIRRCHRALSQHDTPDQPFDVDLSRLDTSLRNAETCDGREEYNAWTVRASRLEWVTLYGLLYTLDDDRDELQEAMVSLIAAFDDETTRLAEHTRDFYDAVNANHDA
jgi:hypothetical protein